MTKTNIAVVFFSVEGYPKTLALTDYESHSYNNDMLVITAKEQSVEVNKDSLIAMSIRRNVDRNELEDLETEEEASNYMN